MPNKNTTPPHYLRHLAEHAHLHSVYGSGWFANSAEKFARFFGTPVFLVTQTVIVFAWIYVNAASFTKFDPYPFILLNLAFSLQAAYAAPLILLAQTRQADRDKAHSEADAKHREEIALEMHKEQGLSLEQSKQLLTLLERNNELTVSIQQLSARIETLTSEIHTRVVSK